MGVSKISYLIDKIIMSKDVLTDFEYDFSRYRLGIGEGAQPRALEDAAKHFNCTEEELLQMEKRITHTVLCNS